MARPADHDRSHRLPHGEAATGADRRTALLVAAIVVALELTTISLIRRRFLNVSLRGSLLQVALGGAMIVAVGVVPGSA